MSAEKSHGEAQIGDLNMYVEIVNCHPVLHINLF